MSDDPFHVSDKAVDVGHELGGKLYNVVTDVVVLDDKPVNVMVSLGIGIDLLIINIERQIPDFRKAIIDLLTQNISADTTSPTEH